MTLCRLLRAWAVAHEQASFSERVIFCRGFSVSARVGQARPSHEGGIEGAATGRQKGCGAKPGTAARGPEDVDGMDHGACQPYAVADKKESPYRGYRSPRRPIGRRGSLLCTFQSDVFAGARTRADAYSRGLFR